MSFQYFSTESATPVKVLVMPQCICKRCKRQFVYDDDSGYSTDVCGPFCDGALAGRARVIWSMRQLAQQLRKKAEENSFSEAELAFEASASSIDRVCDELSA